MRRPGERPEADRYVAAGASGSRAALLAESPALPQQPNRIAPATPAEESPPERIFGAMFCLLS